MKNSKDLTTIYIVRHGETEWNVKGLLQGHKDSPLTKEGVNQAKKISKKLGHIKFDLIFSSDLLRAKRTAEIIAEERKLAIETSRLLRERYFGTFEGKPHHSVRKAFGQVLDSLKENERFKYNFSGGIESDEELTVRLTTFLREAAITYPGKNILVVTHGGTMRALLINLGFGTHKSLEYGAVGNSAYLKLESDGVDFFIKEVVGVIKND